MSSTDKFETKTKASTQMKSLKKKLFDKVKIKSRVNETRDEVDEQIKQATKTVAKANGKDSHGKKDSPLKEQRSTSLKLSSAFLSSSSLIASHLKKNKLGRTRLLNLGIDELACICDYLEYSDIVSLCSTNVDLATTFYRSLGIKRLTDIVISVCALKIRPDYEEAVNANNNQRNAQTSRMGFFGLLMSLAPVSTVSYPPHYFNTMNSIVTTFANGKSLIAPLASFYEGTRENRCSQYQISFQNRLYSHQNLPHAGEVAGVIHVFDSSVEIDYLSDLKSLSVKNIVSIDMNMSSPFSAPDNPEDLIHQNETCSDFILPVQCLTTGDTKKQRRYMNAIIAKMIMFNDVVRVEREIEEKRRSILASWIREGEKKRPDPTMISDLEQLHDSPLLEDCLLATEDDTIRGLNFVFSYNTRLLHKLKWAELTLDDRLSIVKTAVYGTDSVSHKSSYYEEHNKALDDDVSSVISSSLTVEFPEEHPYHPVFVQISEEDHTMAIITLWRYIYSNREMVLYEHKIPLEMEDIEARNVSDMKIICRLEVKAKGWLTAVTEYVTDRAKNVEKSVQTAIENAVKEAVTLHQQLTIEDDDDTEFFDAE